MATDIANIPPSASGGGAATLPSTLVLADATTNTQPDLLVLKHSTSGTAAAGFGETSAVELQNAAGTNKRVMTDITDYVTATGGAEEAQRLISLIQGGTMRVAFTFGYALGANIPTLSFANSGNGLIYNAGTFSVWMGSAQTMQFTTSTITSAKSHTFTARQLQSQGASIASATTVTLGADGNVFPISGTTTINGITTSGWSLGAVVYLKFAGILTLTHNSGAPGGGAVAIKTTTAANVTTAANSIAMLIFDGTFWVQVAPITPGY